MTEILPIPNPNINNTSVTKKPIALIVAVIALSVGIISAFLSFQEASQDSKIIYAEKPPTENSELIYGSSGGVNLEPFSGKTVNAYKVRYSSQEIENFRLRGFVGILIAIIALSFLVYKYVNLLKLKSHDKQLAIKNINIPEKDMNLQRDNFSRQKIIYATAGFLVSLFLIGTPIAQAVKKYFFSGRTPHGLELVAILAILVVFSLAGIFIGLQVDKYQQGNLQKSSKLNHIYNQINKFFSFAIKKRTEGNFIVYQYSHLQNLLIFVCVVVFFWLAKRYIPSPYGNILRWIILLLYVMRGFSMLNDNSRAISKKFVTNSQGKKEIWYEIPITIQK